MKNSTDIYPRAEVERHEESLRRTCFHSAERPVEVDPLHSPTSQGGLASDGDCFLPQPVVGLETRVFGDSRPHLYSFQPGGDAKRSPVPPAQQADASYRTKQRMQYWPAASGRNYGRACQWGSGSGLPARHPSCQLPRPPAAVGGCDGCFTAGICACRRTASGPATTGSNGHLNSSTCNGSNVNAGSTNPPASDRHHDCTSSDDGVTDQMLHRRTITAEEDHHDDASEESPADQRISKQPSHASTRSMSKHPHKRQSSCSWQAMGTVTPPMEPGTPLSAMAPCDLDSQHTCPACGYVTYLPNGCQALAPVYSLSHSQRLPGSSAEHSSVSHSPLSKQSHSGACLPPLSASRLGPPPSSHYGQGQQRDFGAHDERAVPFSREKVSRENVFMWATRTRVQQSLMSGHTGT